MERDKHIVFFTSDTHFSHGNILKYSNRPFMNEHEQNIVTQFHNRKWGEDPIMDRSFRDAYKSLIISRESVERHDETLIANWNTKVPVDGVVFHLGDVCFNTRKAVGILSRLNGTIYLIKGNHDKNVNSFKNKFGWIKDIFELRVKDDDYERGVRNIILCHFAMRTWNKSHKGSFHCFGHSHGNLLDDPNSLSMDVGVDCHNYTPISYGQIVEHMEKKKHKPIDHHGESI